MSESRHEIFYSLCQAAVVVCAVVLLLSRWVAYFRTLENYAFESRLNSSARNERSTPRSFILPATPGVAFHEEAQRYAEAQNEVARCVAALRDLGYQIDGDGTLLNVKVIEAIYTFQIDHGVPATGRLDQGTMRLLKCS